MPMLEARPRRRPVIRHAFTGMNVAPEAIPTDPETFTLSAPPGTDLWRKPPCRETSTAPMLFTSLRFPFVSAEVGISADWRLEMDQAGLVIFASNPMGEHVSPPTDASRQGDDDPPPYVPAVAPTKWVKLGLEFCNNTAHLSSTSANADGADWSITTLPSYHSQRDDLRVKFERLGHALWLYYEDQNRGWRKMREITGFFWGVDDKSVRVGVYASRPASFASNPVPLADRAEYLETDLCVEFEDLMIF